MEKICIVDQELNVAKTTIFSEVYPLINNLLINKGDFVNSRNGDTKEILNFKTEIINPKKRCVGGKNRNINIFFLLAEAFWIFSGKRDVKFLTIFNEKMKDYSDDGISFHAPYGYRLRKFEDKKDQISESLQLLSANKEDRGVVCTIWNPNLDLGTVTKDRPCNDMLMFKVRDEKLHITIQNRSNDLHLGLPTNVFQFSFILEIMSNILNIGVGTQVHNSQSLHWYLSNNIGNEMFNNNGDTLYDFTENDFFIDMNFPVVCSVKEKLKMVDDYLESVICRIQSISDSSDIYGQKEGLFNFSNFLSYSSELLEIYTFYKLTKMSDEDKVSSINKILSLREKYEKSKNCDYELLALNFFIKRIKDVNIKKTLMLNEDFVDELGEF